MRNLTQKQLHILFNTWIGARERCHNPAGSGFSHYGGRGIVMCERWLNSFDAFVADMGPRPEGMSIDRIDVNKGYSPDNCRWADRFTQARNKRDTKITQEELGQVLSLAAEGHPASAIAVLFGVTAGGIQNILARNRFKSVAKANSKPGAKLDWLKVEDIRRRHAAGERTADLALEYGVRVTSICNIVAGRTWKH